MGLGGGVSAIGVVDCAVGAAGCLIPGAGIPACIYSIMRCFISPAGDPALTLMMAGSNDDPIQFYRAGLRAQLDAFNLITGAPDGVWLNPQADNQTGDWYARFQLAAGETSDGGRMITSAERSDLLTTNLPPGVPPAEIDRVLSRWNRTLDNIALGILRPADAPPGANLDFIDTIALREKLVQAAAYHQAALDAGFTDPINAIVETYRIRSQQGEEGGVCAKVKIKLDQEAVLSREAFRATLEIDNATANALENIRVTVHITDGQGNDANALFGLRPPELTGLSDVEGGGRVAGGARGVASWTLVPTVDAAPLEPVQYYVGGEFRYSLNGVLVTVPLSPVPITVNPTARLTLDYFHQRDVYADDPFTDLVEPSIPFNLAVMVRNQGAGAARNFRITSAQPTIIENEKGLLIDFKIIATEVAGQNMTPTLTANFGTIPPGGISVARWLLTSTLQGLFIDYNATFEHLDGQGNPRLSLIDEVRIHEMNRLVQAGPPFDDGLPDFLVNDVADSRDLPDTLWLSDGSSNHVAVATNASVSGTLSPLNLQVELSADLPGGWAYLRVPDPANGLYRLVGVQRSDNVVIRVETNAWVTDRTFIGQGRRPARENILHLLDYNSTGQYTLLYAPLPTVDNEPPASSVEALPAQSHAAFLVRWSGQDNPGGSGVATYDIYFSENGGPFQRWLIATPSASALFQGVLGKTYAFYSIATDQAGNRESAPAAPQAATTVILENRPPVFTPITNQVVVEGATFVLTAAATDPDGDTLTYQLGAGAPPGLVLNSVSGQMSWITAEAHGPSTNLVAVIARDSGIPSLSATQSFAIIVLESNSPPALAGTTNRTIAEGTLLSVALSATDDDLPPQRLTFSLGAGAPAGAAINPTNGLFTWRPTEYQGGTNYTISIIVSDDGSPSLSATQSFVVIVQDTKADFLLSLGSTAILTNDAGSVPLTLQSGVELNQLDLLLHVAGRHLTNLQLTSLAPQVGAANFLPLGDDRYQIQFQRHPQGSWQGTVPLARLAFAAVPGNQSAVATLRGEDLTGTRTDAPTANGQAGVGRVFIVGPEPILDLARSNQMAALTLYALPGRSYAIERRAGLDAHSPWEFQQTVTPANLRTDLAPQPMTSAVEFFRASTLAPAPTLDPGRERATHRRVAGHVCRLLAVPIRQRQPGSKVDPGPHPAGARQRQIPGGHAHPRFADVPPPGRLRRPEHAGRRRPGRGRVVCGLRGVHPAAIPHARPRRRLDSQPRPTHPRQRPLPCDAAHVGTAPVPAFGGAALPCSAGVTDPAPTGATVPVAPKVRFPAGPGRS